MQGLSYEYSFQIRFLFRNGGSHSKYTPKPKLIYFCWLNFLITTITPHLITVFLSNGKNLLFYGTLTDFTLMPLAKKIDVFRCLTSKGELKAPSSHSSLLNFMPRFFILIGFPGLENF
jgi:hypothetical protein